MYYLVVKDKFDAAHHLPGYDGPCANIHGHSWKVEVEVLGNKLQSNGMLIDFQDIKAVWRIYDHRNLNDYFDMPTAENIAKEIFKVLSTLTPVVYVRIWESDNCYAEYAE